MAIGLLVRRATCVELSAQDVRLVDCGNVITAHFLECLLLQLRRTRSVRVPVRRSAPPPPALPTIHEKVCSEGSETDEMKEREEKKP